MSTTMLLIRHAVTAATGRRLGGRTDAVLTDDGRAQASAAAERLAGVRLAAVYTSPLARALETAEIIARPHRLAVRPAEGLLEVDYGRWTDRPLKSVQRTKLWGVILTRPSAVRFPDGEAIRDMQGRAVEAVEELAAAHRGRVVAAVSHGDVIKALVAFYLGQPLDLFQRLHVEPASVTALRLGGGSQPLLLRFNDNGALAAEKAGGGARAGRTTGHAKEVRDRG